jgi:hypothetical protein
LFGEQTTICPELESILPEDDSQLGINDNLLLNQNKFEINNGTNEINTGDFSTFEINHKSYQTRKNNEKSMRKNCSNFTNSMIRSSDRNFYAKQNLPIIGYKRVGIPIRNNLRNIVNRDYIPVISRDNKRNFMASFDCLETINKTSDCVTQSQSKKSRYELSDSEDE